ncbi:hypothetical protein TeGR_g12295 [Tetraparma gracilis]|uniref:UbiA prenyltransferase n=1 Tax=Tetraparma gracilis TaxID=2962635 RepID=A0ABQ6MR68_9STRA|nr:hypothetical protein TeGR_g12295 [Tetraparma gracilis]
MLPYLLALRPWSFTASLVPLLLCAVSSATPPLPSLLLSCLSVLAAQSAGNLVNTSRDFSNNVDDPKLKGGDRTLVDKTISPSAVATMSLVFGVLSLLLDFSSSYLSPPPLPSPYPLNPVHLAGLSLAVLYTAGPLPLKYNALGDLTVLLSFGLLLPLYISPSPPLPLLLPGALLTVAILQGNNHRDLESDRAAGVRTLATLLGPRLSGGYYRCLLFLSYLLPLFFLLAPGSFGLASLPAPAVRGCALGALLTLPLAKPTLDGMEGKGKKDLDEDTAKLHTAHGVAGIVGFVAGGYFGA